MGEIRFTKLRTLHVFVQSIINAVLFVIGITRT